MAWRRRVQAREQALSGIPEERQGMLKPDPDPDEERPAPAPVKRQETQAERVERMRRKVEQTGRALDA